VRDFLERALSGPAGMVVEGEAGMGKTTLLRHAAEAAQTQGFRVLSAAGAPTEVRYAYSTVADLPGIQQAAMERVLLRGREGPATNERIVAAAFLSLTGSAYRACDRRHCHSGWPESSWRGMD
jgi:AAA domain